MSFLAQGLTSGFGLGFSAAQQKIRVEDRAERERAAQIAAELRLAEEMRGRAERADYRAEDREWREREREDRLISGAGSRAKDQLDAAWRAQTANMSGPREQVEMALVRERIAGEKLQNDALANPKPKPPVETVELDPMTGEAMSRKITGPAGSFGALTPPAPSLSAQDQLAVQWAQQNPTDPRSAQILKRLGLAR